VASPEQKLSPAYQAAPEPMLAATAQILMDTPVLEPTPEPVTVEPAPASPEAVDVIDPAAQAAPAEQPASFEAALVDAPVAPGPRGVVRIVIEAIGLDRVPQEVSTDANGVPFVPKHDVAWFRQSAIPGEGENIVLWGHALRFSDTPEVPAPFGQLSKLVPGDRITLYDAAGGERSYRIAQQVWATPDQVQYILPMGREQVTLVSCIGDRVVRENGVTMTHRLITIAEPEA
jgi:hypothetical protein